MIDPFERGAKQARSEAEKRVSQKEDFLSQQNSVCKKSDEFLDNVASRFQEKFVVRRASGTLFVGAGSYEGAPILNIFVPEVWTDLGYFRMGDGYDVILHQEGIHERQVNEARALELAGQFFGRHEPNLSPRFIPSKEQPKSVSKKG